MTTTIAARVPDFLNSIAGLSPRTVYTYACGMRRFAEFQAAGAGPIAIADITETTLQDFQVWLIKGYGRDDRGTIATYVAGARSFLRYLSRRHLLPPDVAFEAISDNARAGAVRGSYRAPRIDNRLPLVVLYAKQMPVPEERQPRLETLRDRAIILTLFSTGMRRAEVTRLDRADIDNGHKNQAIICGKGDRERVVFFSDEALEALRAYFEARADDYEPAFIRHDSRRGKPRGHGLNFRLSPSTVWSTVNKISTLANVPLTTHDFRHAKATTLLNQGAQLSEVQDILGHASPETTKVIYAHYETRHLRDAFDRYSLTAEEMASRLVRA